MSEQLSLFNKAAFLYEDSHKKRAVADSDTRSLSISNSDSDTQSLKHQAIQRYLDSTEKDYQCCVTKYSPGRRSTEYYRLSYRISKRRMKHIHIRGGSVISELATYRAKKLQAMIDRGAELAEVIAAVKTFNSGSI